MTLASPVNPARGRHPGAAAWAVFTLLGAAGGAAAADRCAGSADEAALLTCRQARFDDASRRLEQAIEKLHRRYQDDEPARSILLSASQQAWRSHLQAECRFRTFESATGSAYQAYLLTCLTELSKQRLQDLDRVLAQP